MTTLRRYYDDYSEGVDEFDSSLSISVAVIVLGLILSLGFMYGFPEIRQNSNNTSSGNLNTIEVESPSYQLSNYPEPGSLAY